MVGNEVEKKFVLGDKKTLQNYSKSFKYWQTFLLITLNIKIEVITLVRFICSYRLATRLLAELVSALLIVIF